jgi:hypothetical protein
MANFNALVTCINSGGSTSSALRGYLGGLTLSTSGSSASFAVAAGVATSSDTTTSMNLSSSYSKTTSAWAVGSGTGSLDTGSIANNAWYHVFLIERTDTGVVDVLVSLSPTTPTLPASYTKQRRIGSMKTDGSSHWILFHQLGDEFIWDSIVNDANGANPGTSGTLYTLSVPTGVQVSATVSITWFNVSSTVYVQVSSPDIAAPSVSGQLQANLFSQDSTHPASTVYPVRTNTSAQIRATASGASGSLYFNTVGWIDHRGRDS